MKIESNTGNINTDTNEGEPCPNEDMNKYVLKEMVNSLIQLLEKVNLSGVSQQKLVFLLEHIIHLIPLDTVTINKGSWIVRARINKDGQMFNSEKDLSYRSDIENINYYGRASIPFTSVFYGTLVNDTYFKTISTVISELSDQYAYGTPFNKETFFATISLWQVMDNITSTEICYSEEYINSTPFVKYLHDKSLECLKKHYSENNQKLIIKLLTYISNQFSKKNIANQFEYLISATFSHLLFAHDVEAIIYPSIKVDVGCLNVALPIRTVDAKLKLVRAEYCNINIKDKFRTVTGLKLTKDLGPLNSNFFWDDETADFKIEDMFLNNQEVRQILQNSQTFLDYLQKSI